MEPTAFAISAPVAGTVPLSTKFPPLPSKAIFSVGSSKPLAFESAHISVIPEKRGEGLIRHCTGVFKRIAS